MCLFVPRDQLTLTTILTDFHVKFQPKIGQNPKSPKVLLLQVEKQQLTPKRAMSVDHPKKT